MEQGWPSRRYTILSVLNWLMFVAVVAMLWWGDASGKVPDFVQVPLVLFLGASVAWQFSAAYRSISAQDEFVRGLTFKQGIIAAGVTITGAVLWGLAEQFLDAPAVPMWVVYPAFWGVFGMITPFVKSSHA